MGRRQSCIRLWILLGGIIWTSGCGDDAIEPPEPPRATAITVTPVAATLEALADTVQLGAEVRDQNGRVMAGATVSWLRMTAVAWDANGYTIPGSEFIWMSSDTSIATVDGSGLVRGIAEGVVLVTAARASVTGEVPITVAHEDWGDLVSFYGATGGQGWIANDGWLSDLPIGQWHGVTTDESGYVIELSLSASDLTGPIAPELGNLRHLEVLNLERNALEGSIPPEFGKLRNLKALILGVNDLTGPIPAELGDLANLEVLRLRRNDLTGPVPPELGKLRNLARLGLDWNALAGPMPLNLTSLERLRVLHFPGNESLCAPGSADFASWLARLDVYVGPLCDEADREALASLHAATGGDGWERSGGWLGDGLLEDWHGVGTDSLGRVTTLHLSDNDLVGRVPTLLSQFAGMTSLRISGNVGLTGPLPLSLSALPLQELRYEGTGLCVPLDDPFGEWLAAIPAHEGTGEECAPLSDREILEILYSATGGADWKNSENWLSEEPLGEWNGVRTDQDGRVVGLLLSQNNLVGPIPPELGSLTGLSELELPYNKLAGPIPEELAELPKLSKLNLTWNELAGRIPPELGAMPSLSVLALGGNGLTGSIPIELASLSSLAALYLYNNRLTGPIPPELATLSGLGVLYLANNELTGPIPPELGTHLPV